MLFRSDRKSTRLNSSHTIISYAVFCLKKKKTNATRPRRSGQYSLHTIHSYLRYRTRPRLSLLYPAPPRPDPPTFPFYHLFFLKNPPPPESTPFPPPAPFRS